MSITMYDDVTVSLIPPNPQAVAGYVDGRFANYNELVQKFPNAKHLSITVFGNIARCADVENGDMTIAGIFAWFNAVTKAGIKLPVIYSSVSNMDHIVATMTANGFARDTYLLWSAHYQAGEHVCGPSSCKLTSQVCDGTQWTDTANGVSLDQSLLSDKFFGGTVQQGPFRQVVPAGNTLTFVKIAEDRGTTWPHILSVSQGASISPEHLAVLTEYDTFLKVCTAAPGVNAPVAPTGAIYYTDNP